MVTSYVVNSNDMHIHHVYDKGALSWSRSPHRSVLVEMVLPACFGSGGDAYSMYSTRSDMVCVFGHATDRVNKSITLYVV